MDYDHSPFSKSPLRFFFEETRSIAVTLLFSPSQGNRRTPNIAVFFYHKSPYIVKFGPVIRMISSLADSDKYWGAQDTGLEQRAMSKHRTDFMDAFHNGVYMEMPLGIRGREPIVMIRRG